MPIRQKYIAQYLTEYRNSEALLSHMRAVLTACGCHAKAKGHLLLQKIISVLYENICRFRSTSVRTALQIVDDYEEGQCTTTLTATELTIIAYIGGYVYRKTRDKLKRYSEGQKDCKISTVKNNCESIVEILNNYVPGTQTQTPSISYPNLMALSLTRGGITMIGTLDLELFCTLEICFRPFLNIAQFRDSTNRSDTELVEQLVEHNCALLSKCPYTDKLDHDGRVLLVDSSLVYFTG